MLNILLKWLGWKSILDDEMLTLLPNYSKAQNQNYTIWS